MYRVEKVIDGFSTCFRQWRAKESHCSSLHGYALKFLLTFESKTLDKKNWVIDFAFAGKTSAGPKDITLKKWFEMFFDHTTVVAKDDPYLAEFKDLANKGIIDLVLLDNVGCECFAEKVYEMISKHLPKGVKLVSVKCIENEKNSASYYGK